MAEVLPEHKAEKVEDPKREGKVVAMVGDGIDDAWRWLQPMLDLLLAFSLI